jgi:N-acetylmuramoyl-L-alanine amidase
VADRYLTDLADVLRAAGLDVVELGGWQTRARGSGGYDDGRPTHVMIHHTASPPSSSGESDAWYCATGDEDAPLSNLCLDRDGIWWVLAAGATNTNGAGGPLDGVPADSMNTHAIGVEANGGYGEAWPTVQTDSYVTGVHAICAAYACAYVRAHFEWAPDRKIDPAGPSPWATGNTSWDMDGFRSACTLTPEPEPRGGDDMPMFIAKHPTETRWAMGDGLSHVELTVADDVDNLILDRTRVNLPLYDLDTGRLVTKRADITEAKAWDKRLGPLVT